MCGETLRGPKLSLQEWSPQTLGSREAVIIPRFSVPDSAEEWDTLRPANGKKKFAEIVLSFPRLNFLSSRRLNFVGSRRETPCCFPWEKAKLRRIVLRISTLREELPLTIISNPIPLNRVPLSLGGCLG